MSVPVTLSGLERRDIKGPFPSGSPYYTLAAFDLEVGPYQIWRGTHVDGSF